MTESRKRQLLTAALSFFWAISATGADEPSPYALYLVRHAEKADGPDPGLTPAGVARAEWLSDWLSQREVAAVWSSDYRRSRQTADPAASALGLSVQLYDPRHLEEQDRTLLSRAENALVVGHSNTTPELATMLCQCPVSPMSDSEYDHIIVVTVQGAQRTVSELDANVLRPSPDSR